MEKSLLFIGAGGHAFVLADALRDKSVNILGALAKDSEGRTKVRARNSR